MASSPAGEIPGADNDADLDADHDTDGDLISALEESRRRFLALVEPIRPELHRYCTRMTGSVADGEDVVQETLASACYELAQMRALPPLRPWLFRIAHNRAIDHWRHESHRHAEPIEAAADIAGETHHEPDQVLARRQAVRAALSCFLELPPVQRGCVVQKDVLDHSLEEIAAELDLSVPAVKAALHRGRAALLRLGETLPSPRPPGGEARYFIALQWRDGRVATIRDFRYVPYIVQDRLLELERELEPPPPPDHRSPP